MYVVEVTSDHPPMCREVATIQELRQEVFAIAESVLGIGDLDAVRLCREVTEQGGELSPLPGGLTLWAGPVAA